MAPLPLDEVRRAARAEGLDEIYFNETSRVVSFAPPGCDIDELSRINVYYTTGTVGTCISHPRQGKTQLFRRNVTLAVLREIIRDPRVHTGAGYHRRVRQRREQCAVCLDRDSSVMLSCGHDQLCAGCADQIPRQSGRISCPVCRTQVVLEPTLCTEEQEIQMQLDRIRQEEAALAREKADLETLAATFRVERERREAREREEAAAAARAAALAEQQRREEDARQRAAALAEQQRLAAARKKREDSEDRGLCREFYLAHAADVQSNFDGPTTTCVATNGAATIMLYEDGSFAYTADLPDGLYKTLQKKKLKTPRYVALGSQDRYYIEFVDGSYEWAGSPDLKKKLTEGPIASVAFGTSMQSYFIVYKDGGWYYDDAPAELTKIVGRRGDLDCVSLGSGGEYYVRFRDGTANWGGLTTECLKYIDPYAKKITFLDFGNDQYFLRRIA